MTGVPLTKGGACSSKAGGNSKKQKKNNQVGNRKEEGSGMERFKKGHEKEPAATEIRFSLTRRGEAVQAR